MTTMRKTAVTTCAVLVAVLGCASPGYADESTPTHADGTLPDGRATWVADVPADWQGTLVLYSHGYNGSPDNPATNAPDPVTAQALLNRGFAIAGSSYERSGWTLDTAAQDQIEAVAAFTDQFGKPRRVIALGGSMGGLVTGQLAETAGDVIDGAVATCGLMSGGVQLLNYQTDGLHALAQLITPDGENLKLAGFDDVGEAQTLMTTLTTAVAQAEQSPEGRARLALAAALFQTATWASSDHPQPRANDSAAIAAEQLSVLKSNIPFFAFARYDIEQTNGGNSSWNVGVDYAKLLQYSATRQVVQKMYRDAGLDLGADLDLLTASADVSADPAALQRSTDISGLTGRLQMPMLSTHTAFDTLVPSQIQEEYAETVRDVRSQTLLRQAVVNRVGHCTFTPAEYVAAVLAMDERLEEGHWTPASTVAGLDRLAEELNLGGSEYDPAAREYEWLGDRGGVFGSPSF